MHPVKVGTENKLQLSGASAWLSTLHRLKINDLKSQEVLNSGEDSGPSLQYCGLAVFSDFFFFLFKVLYFTG